MERRNFIGGLMRQGEKTIDAYKINSWEITLMGSGAISSIGLFGIKPQKYREKSKFLLLVEALTQQNAHTFNNFAWYF